eukprot:Hpha_TRINITY_DN942_c0_g1::TRINITY_DN942_c0_g1_i1::g.156325::m.156325
MSGWFERSACSVCRALGSPEELLAHIVMCHCPAGTAVAIVAPNVDPKPEPVPPPQPAGVEERVSEGPKEEDIPPEELRRRAISAKRRAASMKRWDIQKGRKKKPRRIYKSSEMRHRVNLRWQRHRINAEK